MGRRPHRVVLASMLALMLTAAPAGATTPSLKAQFAPLNVQIKKIGVDIGTAINGAKNATDVQLAKSFSGLGQRAAAASIKVSKLTGAKGSTAINQRKLQLALAQVSTDLIRISTDAKGGRPKDVKDARAATVQLTKDSASVKTPLAALAKALGVG
jgi:hypothetical protein